MKRVLAVSRDAFLLRKIELALLGIAEVISADCVTADAHFDLCLWDVDTAGDVPSGTEAVTMSRASECDLAVPFEFSSLLRTVEAGGEHAERQLVCRGRFAYLRGREIKLTELEAALLSLLLSAGGEFVSREEILRSVWRDDADPGIINVYVHYLREKLEDGEKIILSSRKSGYKIDGRYI